MKHIGIVVPKFPVASETFIVTEINALISVGHRVSVFCFEFDQHAVNYLSNTVEIVPLKEEPDFYFARHIFDILLGLPGAIGACLTQKQASKLSLMRYALRLVNGLQRLNCNHIHSHFMGTSLAHAVIASKLSRLPLSCVGHGYDVYQNPIDIPEKLKHCNFVVAVCKDMQTHLRALTPTRVHLIECGVDLSQFRMHKRPKNSVTKLFFIGRLVEKKGIRFALQAIASFNKETRPHLDIIGFGEERSALEALCIQLGIQESVRFLGYRPPTWLQSHTAIYDAMIAPFCEAKNGDRDTGPVVLKESMAMGIPVITTAFMGCKEIAVPEAGWLVRPRDSHGLAKAIRSLNSKTSVELDKMREAARKHVGREFCAVKQAQKLSQLIQTETRHVSD